MSQSHALVVVHAAVQYSSKKDTAHAGHACPYVRTVCACQWFSLTCCLPLHTVIVHGHRQPTPCYMCNDPGRNQVSKSKLSADMVQ